MIKSQIQNIIVQYNFNSLEDQLKLHLYVQQDAVFIGSDFIDSYFDALSAHWVLSGCSLSALWVLTECSLTADLFLTNCLKILARMMTIDLV